MLSISSFFPNHTLAITSKSLAAASEQLREPYYRRTRARGKEMGALCLLPSTPLACSCSSSSSGHSHPPRLTVATPFPSSSAASRPRPELAGRKRHAVVARGRGGGEGERDKNGAASFFGEDGVVEDMDGYLNYLSLEYDSVWDTKPVWCQPWTILLSGTVMVGCSWVFINSVVITAAVFVLICAWWYIFLYSYPKAYSDMIAERRKRVASGVEDTYGMEKIQ